MDSLGTAARRVVVIDDNVAANGAQCVRQSLFTQSLQFTDDSVLGRGFPSVQPIPQTMNQSVTVEALFIKLCAKPSHHNDPSRHLPR